MMNRCFALIKKELTEIFRDKTSIIVIFIVPFLVFPLLNVGIKYLADMDVKNITVYIDGDKNDGIKVFGNYIKESSNITVFTGSAEEAYKRLSDGEISFIVKKETHNNKIKFICNPNLYSSISDASKIGESFSEFYSAIYQKDHHDYSTLVLCNENDEVISTDKVMTDIINPIVFIMLICQTSANFSSDMFAGEKERKTLELMIMTVKSNKVVYFGKHISLLIISLMGLFVNVFSYVITKKSTVPSEALLNDIDHIDLIVILSSLLLLLEISVTVSLLVSLISKKIKESQTINELLISIPIGIAALISFGSIGVNTGFSNYCPIVNLIVMFYRANLGNTDIKTFMIVLIENVIVISALMLLSYKCLNREKTVVSE